MSGFDSLLPADDPPPTQEELDRLEADTNAWFDRIRAGDADAVAEAIHLLRVHALPEDHPLALD